MTKFSKSYNRLVNAEKALINATVILEKELQPYIRFEFKIIQQTDGFCVLNEDTADNVLLSSCIDTINKKGFLTLKEYEKMSYM